MIVDKIGEGHYQTRSGLPVVIEAIKSGKAIVDPNYVVQGYLIDEKGKKMPTDWSIDGIWNAPESSDIDLIPVAQPLPEPKQERPVNVGIPYTNEAERKAAIKQAESYGYKEWDKNEKRRFESDNCIFLYKDGEWFDEQLIDRKTIPLDRSFMEADDADTNVATTFTFPTSDYTKTVNEDGTILLTPRDRDYEANYEKALNFLEGTPEVMWSREDLAKILVEFLNSVK